MRHPVARFVFVTILFLISDAMLGIHPPLPGAVQVADVVVPLLASPLLAGGYSSDLKNRRAAVLHYWTMAVGVGIMFNLCFVTHRVPHW